MCIKYHCQSDKLCLKVDKCSCNFLSFSRLRVRVKNNDFFHFLSVFVAFWNIITCRTKVHLFTKEIN